MKNDKEIRELVGKTLYASMMKQLCLCDSL